MCVTLGHSPLSRKYLLPYAYVAEYVSYVHETSPSGGVRLDLAEFDRLTTLRGWDTDRKRVRALGISNATMSRIRTGRDRPGARFIHLSLAALDVPYNVLFFMDEAERAAS
jgi:hypothetical protein